MAVWENRLVIRTQINWIVVQLMEPGWREEHL